MAIAWNVLVMLYISVVGVAFGYVAFVTKDEKTGTPWLAGFALVACFFMVIFRFFKYV